MQQQQEGGVLTLGASAAAGLYESWLAFGDLEIIEQALRRASNGLAFVGLGCGVCYSFDGNSAVVTVYVVPLLLIGAVRFFLGWRVLRQLPMGVNGIGLKRGFLRLGMGALVLLLRTHTFLFLQAQGSPFLAYWLATVYMTMTGWYYLLSGATRIYLTRAQAPARPKPPNLHPSPRGDGRNATRREARGALRGGQGTKLDEQQF